MKKKLQFLITLSRIKIFGSLYNSKEVLDKKNALENQLQTVCATIHETLKDRERSFLSGEKTLHYDGFLRDLRAFERTAHREIKTLKQGFSEHQTFLEKQLKQKRIFENFSQRKYGKKKNRL
ncbi:hypothetical protein [Chlamydiifrater phoenicopteri]|uniref:hypothetical protein n=1 Tax=Chlamydiifrater phoenicopteri TaxID=2681469 RepID=UPI001BCDE524|nr:hypothetical protein [Chlamydiifrater phoenicopteri]